MKKGIYLIVFFLTIIFMYTANVSSFLTSIRYRPVYSWKVQITGIILDILEANEDELYVLAFDPPRDHSICCKNLVLYKIDKNKGKILWKNYFVEMDELAHGLILNDNVLLCITESGISKIDTKTSNVLEFIKLPNEYDVQYNDRKLFLYKGTILNILDRYSLAVEKSINLGAKIFGNIILDNNNIFCALEKQIIRYDTATDSKQVIFDYDNVFSVDLYTNIRKAGNRVIVFNYDDPNIYCINLSKNEIDWHVVHDKFLKNNFYLQFVITNEACLVNWEGIINPTICCYSIESGEKKWTLENTDSTINSKFNITYRDDKMFCASIKNIRMLIDINSGKIIAKNELHQPIYFMYKLNDSLIVSFRDDNNGDMIFKYLPAVSVLKFKTNSKTLVGDADKIEMEQPMQNIKGVTYIPAKYLVEPLGGQIFWNQKTKQIKSNLIIPGSETLYNTNPDKYEFKENVLELTVNSNKATLNGKQVQIDPNNPKITPIIINGRTMVPLRFLAESLGCKVEWKADTKEIIVTYQP